MATSKHPQTDGAAEIMNRMIRSYLRCYCAHHQPDSDQLLPSAEFAYNSATISHLGMCPFELDAGWVPRSPLDISSKTLEPSVQSVRELKEPSQHSLEDARSSLQHAQARKAAYNSKRGIPLSYKAGEHVFLSRKLFSVSFSAVHPSRKIGHRHYGHFKITELIGRNALRLMLPKNINILPVVHLEHTERAYTQPKNSTNPALTPAQPFVDETGETVIEIEKILAHRNQGRGHQFLALPKHASSHEAERKPLCNFLDPDGTITEALYQYIREHDIPHNLQ